MSANGRCPENRVLTTPSLWSPELYEFESANHERFQMTILLVNQHLLDEKSPIAASLCPIDGGAVCDHQNLVLGMAYAQTPRPKVSAPSPS
jgi:hypothetical protein